MRNKAKVSRHEAKSLTIFDVLWSESGRKVYFGNSALYLDGECLSTHYYPCSVFAWSPFWKRKIISRLLSTVTLITKEVGSQLRTKLPRACRVNKLMPLLYLSISGLVFRRRKKQLMENLALKYPRPFRLHGLAFFFNTWRSIICIL